MLKEVKSMTCLLVFLVGAGMSSGVLEVNANSSDRKLSSPSGEKSKMSEFRSGENRQFSLLSSKYFDWMTSNFPSHATFLGIHKYDSDLEDYSPSSQEKKSRELKSFLSSFQKLKYKNLKRESQVDWNLLVADIKSKLLEIDSIQSWKVNPDKYSSSANNSIYTLMQRDFAPLSSRLQSIVERQKKIPQFLEQGIKNVESKRVPKIHAQIALEQMPGIIDFFQKTLPKAFSGVKDKSLAKEFKRTNSLCVEALKRYRVHIRQNILPVAKGQFAIGKDFYKRKLYCEELVDKPLDKLLEEGESELIRLQKAFLKYAKRIDPNRDAMAVYTEVASEHPTPDKLVSSVSGVLEEIRSYCIDKNICTIPGEERARVTETPAFMRALIFAAMDTPGPFEKKAKEAYYYVTVPESSWSAKRTEEHMRTFSNQDLLNTSIHEAYPGHYTQFLWVNKAPTANRKIFGCMSNAEGWAHYCELMMLEQGFNNNDSKLKLTQIHDALLRVCRYIAGIKMHTRGMSLEKAVELFEKEGYQEHANALREAKRGTMDPTYLVYTLGKLEILSMREEYRKKYGDTFELKKFHDAFLKQGYPPLALVRAQMFKEPVKKYF